MKFKKVIKKVLFDPKHWFGWSITTAGIVLLFAFFGINDSYTPIYRVGLILGVIIIIDLLKHKMELQ